MQNQACKGEYCNAPACMVYDEQPTSVEFHMVPTEPERLTPIISNVRYECFMAISNSERLLHFLKSRWIFDLPILWYLYFR
jgi:hypothetical protein